MTDAVFYLSVGSRFASTGVRTRLALIRHTIGVTTQRMLA